MRVLAIACIALAVFVGCCSAAVTFKADFKMANQNQLPNGYVTGVVYYHYDADKPKNSVVRIETDYYDSNGVKQTHIDLYHYENGAMYSLCSQCEADVLLGNPEPWYKINSDFNCNYENGFATCDRTSAGFANSVVKVSSKGTPGNNDFKVRYVMFQDGREFTFTSFDTITFSSYENMFKLPVGSDCPAPQCRSFVDVVFVLDASSSVDDKEWAAQIGFLNKAVGKFVLTPNDANVGIVEFAAPWQTCCCGDRNQCGQCYSNRENDPNHFVGTSYNGSWMYYTCSDPNLHLKTQKIDNWNTRYLDDCVFDQRCLPEYDDTAEVFLKLGYKGVTDTVSSLKRIYGHTCQRYGLQKAYEMLFEKNDRCPKGTDRSQCPTPIVIVVTDGEDLCHKTTTEWAEKIKNADKRGLLVEVGVGLHTEFDKNFIKTLSTEMPGTNMEFNVDSHAQLDTILDRLLSPACTMGQINGTRQCGSSCYGQCVCGDCLCPQCNKDGFPICKDVACNALTPDRGCMVSNAQCTVTDEKCFTARCDDTETNVNNRCKSDPIDCRAVLAAQGHPLKDCEYTMCQNGCHEDLIYRNNTYCKERAGADRCNVGICDPEHSNDNSGCVFKYNDCKDHELNKICLNVFCKDGECRGENCETTCTKKEGENMVLKCPPEKCMNVTCDSNAADEEHRCIKEPVTCPSINNKCRENICQGDDDEHFGCAVVPIEGACDDLNKAGACRTYACDADVLNADGSHGACVPKNLTHDPDNCIDYTCGDDDMWIATPKCPTTKACKLARCDDSDGSCYEVDNTCRGKVKLPNKCFEAACREPDGCYKKQYRDAYFDVCGNCISAYEADSTESFSSETVEECTMTSEEDLPTEGLAAAAIALIVVGAILIGAAIALSSIVGTKALIDRANDAADQAVVSNPLFEDSQTEMSNPAFMGETV